MRRRTVVAAGSILAAVSAPWALCALAACIVTAAVPPQAWEPPAAEVLRPPARLETPSFACTAEELARLRAALADAAGPVAARVARARRRLGEALEFPPRGGQHNQWYQCETCQFALTTVDPTHHRCGRCGVVYSGPPYDDVVFSRQHADNLERAREAAWAYALTGEAVFAEAAAAVLHGYADRYERYPYHSNDRNPAAKRDSGGHLKEQTLSEAAWFVGSIAPALDLVWPALPAPTREHVLACLVRPLVANVAKCRRGKSNWQSWHNAALFTGGVLLGDAELMRRSVLDPAHGFLFQMERCVSPEGMWYENSFGYHLYTLNALVHHAAAAQRVGIDLFGHPSLQRMATLPARYVLADGRLPRLGDDVDSTLDRASASLETVFAYTRAPRLAAVLPAETTWATIQFGRATSGVAPPVEAASELFESAGHAILRRPAWQASALLTFAPFGGFHDHFDRLSFVWHARGRERGLDPGRAASQAYRLPIHAGWYRATLAHNTVVVDGRSQRGAPGELLGFVCGEGFDAVAARTTGAYPGVEHRRCLVLTDRCLIVLDHLVAERPRTFDWLYHDRARGVHAPAAAAAPPAGSAGALGVAGEEFVAWQHTGTTDGDVLVTFTEERPVCTLHVAAGGPTTVRTGTGPFRSTTERAPFVLLRREGDVVAFAAVLADPEAGAEVDVEETASGVAATVQARGVRERFHWNRAGVVERRP